MFLQKDDMDVHALLSKNAYELRGLMNINSDLDGYEQDNAKEYYIATVLDELIKLLTSIIRWEDDFKDGFNNKIADTLVRNLIIQGFDSEISMHYRKLIEVLIELLLWKELDNSDDYIKYFYLVKSYNIIKYKNSDLKHFYNIESESYKNKLNDIKNKIVYMFEKVDENKCFFVNTSSYTTKIEGKKIHLREATLKDKLKSVLKIASDSDKLLLGFSYDKYSYTSSKLHFNSELVKQNSNILVGTIRLMMIIMYRIVYSCAEILKIQDLQEFKSAEFMLNKLDESIGWYTPLIKDIYNIDDYVYTYSGKIGRITDKITSAYGYKSYRVLFLETYDDEVIEDYYPAYEFKRIQPKEELYKMAFEIVPELKELYEKEKDEERLKASLDFAMTMIWNISLKNKLVNLKK